MGDVTDIVSVKPGGTFIWIAPDINGGAVTAGTGDLLKVAKTRPPLSVGAAYWDALTTAQGSVEANTMQPMDALNQVQTSIQPQLTTAGC